jgi:hypothetical protein
MNENGETRYDGQNLNTSEPAQTASVAANATNATKASKGAKIGGTLLTGVVAAASGMAGGAMMTGFTQRPEESGEQAAANPTASHNIHAVAAEPDNFDGSTVPVATGVSDDMSFSQAFAAARAEVGPGGVFEWHGKYYGTYYADEWAGFSDEYKREFSNYHYGEEHANEPKSESVIDGEPQPASGEPVQRIDASVHFSEPETMELPNGETITAVYVLDENGEAVGAYIDVDNDGVFDGQVFADGSAEPLATPVSYSEIISGAADPDTATVVLAADDDVVVLHDELDGHPIAYVPTTIDGDNVVFVDGAIPDENGEVIAQPLDGNYDIAIVSDSQTGEQQIYDLRGQGVDNDFIQNVQDDPAAKYVDYTAENNDDFNNDADINLFDV